MINWRSPDKDPLPNEEKWMADNGYSKQVLLYIHQGGNYSYSLGKKRYKEWMADNAHGGVTVIGWAYLNKPNKNQIERRTPKAK